MGRIVQKFGGSALPDIESIKKAAEIAVRSAEERHEVTAVVTSIGQTSDQLRAIAESVATSPNARDLDLLLASAEQASAALLSMAIQAIGWPARSFTAQQAGIVTESRHGDAPIREICTDEIERSLERGEIAVVAGFQGITANYEVTTVGDGGADAAAVALACSLEAERCDVFSQNQGICTADPFIVSEARVLPAVSYEEMMELSASGLLHLHPQAVELAMDNNVPLRIRPINNYANLGTLITHKGAVPDNTLCSIALDEDQASISIKVYTTGGDDRSLEGFAALFARLDELNISTESIMLLTREDEPAQELTFTVRKRHVPKVRAILESLQTAIDHPIVRVDQQISTISMVGRGLNRRPEVVGHLFEMLNRASIPVTMVSSSDLRISVVMPSQFARQAVKLVHSRFELPFRAID